MAFPISPVNGQTTTVNGIRYIYSLVSNSWSRIPSGKYTAAATGPSNPATGDHWYNTSEDTLYEYINDGVSSYWIDIQTGFVGGNSGSVLGDTTITGNLVPSANITYSLGTSTLRFKDLFLSGSTIDLGGATIKTDATSGAIALIPQPTVSNPNPTGIVVSPAGTVSTVSTTGGTLTANAISNSSNTAVTTNTTTFANVTTSNIYADRFFYSNGTAFSSSSFGNTEVAAYLVSSNAVVGTAAINLPSGTSDQRPSSAKVGMIRYNYTLGRYEGYLPAGGWQGFLSDQYSIDYLIVAGGGAGGVWHAGGGGAGGVIASSGGYTVIPNSSYTITVGAGGSGGNNPTTVVGSNGSDSTAFSQTAIGGGRGGNYDVIGPAAGGSGGGGNGDAGGSPNRTLGAPGTAGQGYAGGNGVQGHAGGGGGGGGGVGSNAASSSIAGGGGVGYQWLNGSYYAGGGGGGTWPSGTLSDAGAGGNGGGGRGSYGQNTNPPTAGTANTGGGGGGNGGQGNNTSWAAYIAGGSGVVIVRYLGTQRGTGGTYSFSGGYSYHTFTGSGSFTA